MDNILSAVFAAIVGAAILGFVFLMFREEWLNHKERKEKKAADEEKLADSTDSDGENEGEDEDGEELPELAAYEATLVDKYVETFGKGKNVNSHAVEFWLAFETEDGEKKFKVSRDYFDKLTVGDKGTLVVEGDHIFDFGEGEEVVEEAGETEA